VPYPARRDLLAALAGDGSVDELLDRRRDGAIKLLVLRHALDARADHPSCVGRGSGYLPLAATGTHADHVIAFARVASDGSDALLVVAPRLPGGVMEAGSGPPLGAAWGDTALRIPGFVQGEYRDIFAGGGGAVGDTIALSDLLRTLPVAVLERN
jgi:(1->4)-alpha-D-glucan 1-alpha-D-glucosylmutase